MFSQIFARRILFFAGGGDYIGEQIKIFQIGRPQSRTSKRITTSCRRLKPEAANGNSSKEPAK